MPSSADRRQARSALLSHLRNCGVHGLERLAANGKCVVELFSIWMAFMRDVRWDFGRCQIWDRFRDMYISRVSLFPEVEHALVDIMDVGDVDLTETKL